MTVSTFLVPQPSGIQQDLEFIEFFAGTARATLAAKGAGLKAARLDYLYHNGDGNNYFDILSDAGFASPSIQTFLTR